MNAPLVRTLNTINLLCTLPTYLRYILILYSPTPSLPRRLSFRFLHQNPVCIFLLTLIISGKDYKARSYSLCSFLKPPFTSSFIGPNVFISMPFHSLSQYHSIKNCWWLFSASLIENSLFKVSDCKHNHDYLLLFSRSPCSTIQTSSYCPLRGPHCHQACFKISCKTTHSCDYSI